MDLESLQAELNSLFDPEPDDDGGPPTRDLPHPRLEKEHHLDLSYLGVSGFGWEATEGRQHFRVGPSDEARLEPLIRNLDVPGRLIQAGLRLFGDSILAYHGRSKRKGDLRYYPAIILTCWSGFETFVRHTSELMLITVPNVPAPIAHHLRDTEAFIDRKGDISARSRYHPVLDRYALLLRYGHRYNLHRGSKHWRRLEQARALRDYYTHLDVNNPRSLSSADVLEFVEAVLLGIIWPSAEMRRTLLLGVYNLYWIWDQLRRLAPPFVEQPFFSEWRFGGPHTLYCPFEGVNAKRFPNEDEESCLGDLQSG